MDDDGFCYGAAVEYILATGTLNAVMATASEDFDDNAFGGALSYSASDRVIAWRERRRHFRVIVGVVQHTHATRALYVAQ